jgi:peptide-methionine (S)-S-oxide reductase
MTHSWPKNCHTEPRVSGFSPVSGSSLITMKTYVLAGGCFWCLDAAYRVLRGVHDVVSGYTGGHTDHPNYDQVCSGATGHAEAVAVTFDPAVIPSDVILDAFFTMHDPRQLNRQGHDVGTQYRSAMFYRDDEEKALFEAAIARANEMWGGGVVTEVSPLGEYFDAEEYHQDFFAKNPTQGYCLAVAVPKVQKVRQSFGEYLLPSTA